MLNSTMSTCRRYQTVTTQVLTRVTCDQHSPQRWKVGWCHQLSSDLLHRLHTHYWRQCTTYYALYSYILEMSTGPGRIRAGPGSSKNFKIRVGPNLAGPGRTISKFALVILTGNLLSYAIQLRLLVHCIAKFYVQGQKSIGVSSMNCTSTWCDM